MSRDDDKTWAELVDTFHSSPAPDGDQPWPAAEEVGPDDDRDDLTSDDVPADGFRDASVTLGPLGPGPGREQTRDEAVDVGDDAVGTEASDHFVPPTPAPIPRGDGVSRLAWAAVIAPPIALIIVAIMSWRPSDEIVLFAVLAFITGFVTLIARMRGHHPNDPDDGAVL
ncbi:hypothetical protein [Jiangella asiatica]|uniref:DUF308 domain-containing protein n=1 Tax=Jiangella asiatica TaxID=2530372 RepID=A0A4R5CD82_9ACTN|nr:hypothetical protein [Jiangella asiatica]TDD96869.1 hypothetical protein E1269_30070 [Jiangella asiatica]